MLLALHCTRHGIYLISRRSPLTNATLALHKPPKAGEVWYHARLVG